mgnify:CR=1 FL=1
MKRKILFSSYLGSVLEFYDFTLYGVFLVKLSEVFFPGPHSTGSLFGSFFAFSAAFWTRPLGALLFGYIGDRLGRKKALTWSISLMAIPTFMIGILPGFEEIGYAAPLLLILCRMVQGLCTGGEFNGSIIFTLEHFGPYKAGTISGLISSASALGLLLATFVGAIAIAPYMPSWSWRIAFMLGAFIGSLGFYIRRYTQETDAYLSIQPVAKQTTPLIQIWQQSKLPFSLSILVGATNAALSYTLFGFLSLYLHRYVGVKIFEGVFYNIFGLGMLVLMSPVFGGLSDQITPRKSICLSSLLILLISPVSFHLLQIGDFSSIIVGQMILGTLVASFVGPSHAFMQSLFPASSRYTGIAVGYSLGVAFAGGTTSMILLYLLEATHSLNIPSLLLVCYAAVILSVLKWNQNAGAPYEEKELPSQWAA